MDLVRFCGMSSTFFFSRGQRVVIRATRVEGVSGGSRVERM